MQAVGGHVVTFKQPNLTLDDTLGLLRMVRPSADRTGWYAACPVHDDHQPSLSITQTVDHKILVYCHRCSVDLGKRRFLVEFWRTLRNDGTPDPVVTARLTRYHTKPHRDTAQTRWIRGYTYLDRDGNRQLCRHDRLERIDTTTGEITKSFAWRHNAQPDRPDPCWLIGLDGHKPGLYGAWKPLPDAVWLTEGEKDCEALWGLDVAAVSVPDGAGYRLTPADLDLLRGRTVTIAADDDPSGIRHARAVAAQLTRAGIANRVVLPPEPHNDVADAVAAGNTDWRDDNPPPATLDWLHLVDFATLRERTDRPREWVIHGLLEIGHTAAVHSPSGAGKSLLALEIVTAIATGNDCFGVPTTPRNVLYVDLENSEQILADRLDDLGYDDDDADLHRLHYSLLPEMNPLDTAEGAARMLEAVDELEIDVVVIDTTSRVIEGEENSSDTFTNLYRLFVEPLKARGKTLIRLDHTGKDLGRGQRGSSAKAADLDVVYRLEQISQDRVDLIREKNRANLDGPDVLHLHRTGWPLRHRPIAVVRLDEQHTDLASVIEEAGLTEAPIRKVKAELRRRGFKFKNVVLEEVLRRMRGTP